MNVATSAAIGGGVALATGGVGTKMTSGLAVRELAGEVPQGTAQTMQQSIAAGTGVLAATGVSEELDATVSAGGQLLDSAAEGVSNFASEAYEQVQSLGEPCNEPGSYN